MTEKEIVFPFLLGSIRNGALLIHGGEIKKNEVAEIFFSETQKNLEWLGVNIHHHSRLDSGESLIPLLEYFSLNKSASLGGNGTVNNALNNPRNIDVLILGDITYVTKYSDDKRANFERLMREARNVGIAVIASISREMVSENDLNNLTHTIPNTILGGVDDVELGKMFSFSLDTFHGNKEEDSVSVEIFIAKDSYNSGSKKLDLSEIFESV